MFEVEEILEICYGNPNNKKSSELHFKIRWKGYGSEYDTQEPLGNLSSSTEKLKEYVLRGYSLEYFHYLELLMSYVMAHLVKA